MLVVLFQTLKNVSCQQMAMCIPFASSGGWRQYIPPAPLPQSRRAGQEKWESQKLRLPALLVIRFKIDKFGITYRNDCLLIGQRKAKMEEQLLVC